MNATDTTMPGLPPDPPPDKGVVSSGWLGSQSIFERPDERKLGRAMGASLAAHGVLLAALVFLAVRAPAVISQVTAPLQYRFVVIQQPGPGGGGGGSPAPAPKKELEIPRAKPPEPIPVTPTPVPVVEPPPKPTLNAPVETNLAAVLQSAGQSSVSLAPYGGGGRGGGVGPGTGTGLGPGTGGGFGGGAYRPGAGINNPTLLRMEQPKYTSEAMRAKIQGLVAVEAVVQPDGTVGQVRILKSLDKQYGLDQEALAAARKWLFRPGTDKDGNRVPVIVIIELEFRLH